MRRAVLVMFFCLSISLFASSAGWADSFLITEGNFGHSLFVGRGSFDLAGPDIQAFGGIIDPFPNIFGPSPTFSPGASIPSFNTRVTELVGGPPPSTFILQGEPFSGRGAAYTLQVAGGPFTLPSILEPSVTVDFPVALTGTLFQCPSPAPCNSFAFPVHALSGDGIGSIRFNGSFGGAYAAEAFNATFAAVPEPGSFLLLASGLVGLGIWRMGNHRNGIHG